MLEQNLAIRANVQTQIADIRSLFVGVREGSQNDQAMKPQVLEPKCGRAATSQTLGSSVGFPLPNVAASGSMLQDSKPKARSKQSETNMLEVQKLRRLLSMAEMATRALESINSSPRPSLTSKDSSKTCIRRKNAKVG
ncbi:uncharacterized protein MYCFIDRAFT_212717 [Pseudocercospora fijiensis CIRAD86]|uniref:Uncharacterized protein n=1 Tax=Pseudocercospora fijiensis (strain CIRAD86) TaxID=383855 RepID=M2ZY49_PSEFD|nr:uncharacterized protein MYCFIDRAFT_212717 [Pseudocercospora fijiensis CIRAD86]EME77046.1 hypothetical protein MYCFIDRAFT_212717 [Pseudocercospora fijiensis CIRAD86]